MDMPFEDTGLYPEPHASIQHFTPNFPKIHSNIISRLRLRLPSGFYPSDFPTKILYTFLVFPMRATCPTHLRASGVRRSNYEGNCSPA